MKQTTISISLPNGRSHDVTNQLELALENSGYSKERVVHYSFLLENALHIWRSRLPEDAVLSYARTDSSKDLVLTVELKGPPCDPFAVSDEEVRDRLSPAALVDRLLSGVGNEVRYVYRKGVNRLRIRLPRKDVDRVIFRRNLFVLLVPIAIESLLETIAASVDALMLSFTDSFAMSAVTLVMGYTQFHGYIITGCVIGATALISQYWGVRDRDGIGKVASLALKVSVYASAVFGIATLCFPQTIMELYTNVPEIVERGVPYVRMTGLAFLLAPFYRVHYCCIRALGRPKASMAYAIVGCAVNVILNAIFIYGLFGAPKLGTLGVGIATVASSALQVILAAADYARHHEFRFDIFRCPLLHGQVARTFAKNAVPTVAQCLVWVLGSNVISSIVGHMNADVVAANSLLMLIFGMLLCLQTGYGSAAGLLIGNLLGKGRLEQARYFGMVVMRLAFKIGLLVAVFFAVVGFLLRYLPLDMNANVVRLTGMMIPIFCVNTVFGMMNSSIGPGALYIGGDAKGLLMMDGLFMWGFLVPAGLIGAYLLHMPELALIAIIRNDETLSFPLKWIRFRAGKWLNNLTKDCRDKE